jgi:hypothetical protein
MRLKLKVFLAVLLGTLCIGGAVTVFASDSIPTQKVEFNDGYVDIPDVSHKYFILRGSDGNLFVVFNPSKVVSTQWTLRGETFSGTQVFGDSAYVLYSGVSAWSVFGNSASVNFSLNNPDVSYEWATTEDLYFDDGTLAFRGPVSLVQSAAALPETLIPLAKVTVYGNYIVGSDLMLIIASSIMFWITARVAVGLPVFLWKLLPFT